MKKENDKKENDLKDSTQEKLFLLKKRLEKMDKKIKKINQLNKHFF